MLRKGSRCGDFNGDGKPVSSLDWHAEAVGDFDGHGNADIIWRNVSTEDVVVWLMNGLTLKQAAYVATPNDLNWSIVAPR